ncbi:hypothetical protein [uncultured Campylobacter sp.]|mgnify:FL=1|uniref:hypothetical protein n=1 Tax=uncultured Campylobacter sp. TaxID=218934 RepID=UPI002630E116|nr:hypothetical protein [uncultured Campylobacter sp.]
MNTELLENLKRFFEVRNAIDRLDMQIKELREDRKNYLDTLERLSDKIEVGLHLEKEEGKDE